MKLSLHEHPEGVQTAEGAQIAYDLAGNEAHLGPARVEGPAVVFALTDESFAVLTEEGKRRLRDALPDHLLEIDSLWMSQLADERDVVLGKLRRVRDNARRWPNGRPGLGPITPDRI